MISGSGPFADIAVVGNFSGGITNSGLLNAGTGDAIADQAAFAFSGGITNTGTISGDFGINFVGGPAVSIFDSGVIKATDEAIAFGLEINTLTLEAGYTITGAAVEDPLNSGNILLLGGSGNGSFDLSQIGSTKQYQDFATFAVTGGDWLAYNAGNENWTLTGGTFELAASASITDNVTFAGAATLQLDGNDNQITGSISSASVPALGAAEQTQQTLLTTPPA
jgi:hypothetical protein